jgi:hypothetical protein
VKLRPTAGLILGLCALFAASTAHAAKIEVLKDGKVVFPLIIPKKVDLHVKADETKKVDDKTTLYRGHVTIKVDNDERAVVTDAEEVRVTDDTKPAAAKP